MRCRTMGEIELSDVGIIATRSSDGQPDRHDRRVERRRRDAYVIIDTGFWIFGKKRLIAAGMIKQVDDDSQPVFIGMSKDQVKDAPDFEDDHRSRRDDHANYCSPTGGPTRWR